MQLCTNDTETSIEQLTLGLRQPQPRDPRYVQNDENIQTAIDTFNFNTNHLINPQMPDFQQRFRGEVVRFLDYVQYLVGNQ